MSCFNSSSLRRLCSTTAGIFLGIGTLLSQINISLHPTAVPDSFEFRMVSQGPVYNAILNATFTIRWDASAGGTVNVPGITSDCFRYVLYDNGDGVQTSGGFNYFTFNIAGTSALGTTCPVNTTQAPIGGFAMQGLSGCTTINLVNDAYTGANNKNYFVSNGGVDVTGLITGAGVTHGVGSACSDGNACTTGDAYDANCQCVGTPSPDSDGDGICNAEDDCPTVPGEIGSPCNDGNPCTVGDALNASCNCVGTPDNTDSDGDGVPNCSDDCPTVPGEIGSACDDGNPLTINDQLNGACVCAGTPVSCVTNGDCNDSDPCTLDECVSNACQYTPITTDGDGDGIPDCSDDCPNTPGEIGSACDDGDPCTINDQLNASCNCVGTPDNTDSDGDGVPNCSDDCPTVPGEIGSACDDGNPLTVNDQINANCICAGTPVSCVTNGDCDDSDPCTLDECVGNACQYTPITTDSDGDGIPDCSDDCPNTPGEIGSACDDGDPCTINDQLNASCNCVGTPDNTDGDGDGVPNCSDDCPTVPGEIGSACDDGNPLTVNDQINANCICAGTPVSCVTNGDCDDSDPCTLDECVSNACQYTPITTDGDGDGIPDCSDDCPNIPGEIGSACDDGDPCTTGDVLDAGCNCSGTPDNTDTDGDGIPNCSDDCPSTPGEVGSACDDGNPGTINDTVNGSCQCVGIPIGCTEFLFLDITLDNFGSETTVDLLDQTGTIILDSSGPYADGIGGTTVSDQFCVNPGCYRLRVNDAGGNGIDGGGYLLKDAAGRRIIDADGQFGSVSTMHVGTPDFCVPLSNQGLIPYSCDRADLLPNTTLYCNGQPGASGWQWWWFDPHGSYSRRILVTTNHMKANQMVTNPVPYGLELNIRVRALIGGNYTAFGKACTAVVNDPGGAEMNDEGITYQTIGVDGSSSVLSIYPNPNRDGVVYVMIDGLDEVEREMAIDVYDLFGKRVHAEVVTIAGGTVNHVMDLSGDLALGMYVVNVTIDGKHFTQRLLKQ